MVDPIKIKIPDFLEKVSQEMSQIIFTDPESSKRSEENNSLTKSLDNLGDTFFSKVKELENQKSLKEERQKRRMQAAIQNHFFQNVK